jgi:hypothetical protein
MKKTIKTMFILLGISAISFQVNAQEPQRKQSLEQKSTSINAVYAIPIGDFRKTDLDNGSYAGNGWGISLKTNNIFAGGISFASTNSYNWVDFNTKAFQEDWSNALGGLKTEISGGKHRPFFSTYGLGYNMKLAKNLRLNIGAQAGILYNSFKSLDVSVYDSTNALIYQDNLRMDSGFAFAYSFNAEIVYTLIPNLLGIQLSGDYTGSKFKTRLRSDHVNSVKTAEQLQFINIHLGIVIFTK